MPSISIKWRPSGGRGEYEFKVIGDEALGKRIDVEVPSLGVVIETDAHLRIKDGKPRLRRASPNDRKKLNVPPLVAAIAALPEPRREDDGKKIILPLSEKSYVVEEIDCAITSSDNERIVVKPITLKPRNGEYIDIESRINDLISVASTNKSVADWLAVVAAGSNSSSSLGGAAKLAHNSFPYNDSPTSPIQPIADEETDAIIADYVGTEGKEKLKIHRYKERDKKLVRLAKQTFKATYGKIFCECCGIDFKSMYSSLGEDFIEAHHRTPLSQINEESQITFDDLAMLCSNCHRMVHRTKDCSVEEVQALILQNNAFISRANIKLLK